MTAVKNDRKTIIDDIIRHAKKRLAANQLALVTTFIRQYFSNVPLDELNGCSIDDLYAMVLAHWNLIYQRKAGEAKIRAFNPNEKDDGWQTTHTILAIVIEDMPFLVDSMRMELNRLGYTTHLVIHLGGMQVQRNAKGEITQLFPFESEVKEGLVEAPIYMEIDRQNSKEKLREIEENLRRILNDVQVIVADWDPMQEKVRDAIDYLKASHLPQEKDNINEAIAFLQWMLDEHFTFIGYRDYKIVDKGGEKSLKIVPKSGLGVLRDERHSKSVRHLSSLPPEAKRLALSKDILIISKTNTKSSIHRPTYTDYIGVKKFNKKGEVVGEFRFIGLFTSDAYNSEPQDIPFFRRKVDTILEHSGVLHHGHAAKALLNILETLPRDDFFQGSIEDLTEMALGIWHLQERRRIRLFVRKDAYNRYMSCLVYVPRDNINTDLILKMQQVLVDAFNGHEVSYTTYFPESILARIHYIIRINPKVHAKYDVKAIENELVEVGRTWKDSLRTDLLEVYGEEKANELIARYISAFPAGYRDVFTTRSAVYDIARIEELRAGSELAMSFYRPQNAEGGMLRFKLYRFDQMIPLSDALPMLENMGLRVLGEQPYEIFLNGRSVWINDFHMYYPYEKTIDVEEMKQSFHDTFYYIWKGFVGNDKFNRLVLSAKLSWRQVRMLRAYSKYLRQAGVTFSQDYIAEAVNNNPDLSKLLVDLFEARFNPELGREREKLVKKIRADIEKQLDQVASLDEDRIIRRYVNVIMATLRTNFYQRGKNNQIKPYIAFKFDSTQISDLPLPLPAYEAFVYSPRVEGVHLRSSSVARGGLRWSDRREDYRTEVLGLMKAQQVKNAVIVPSGAKGGFVCKHLPVDGSREDIMTEAVLCYKIFVCGLLDLVDNIVNDRRVTPKNTVRYDGKDAYLVVAADKGTATFSDIANSISKEYNFWLGDAFASGGSMGYDHKKIGITARGAWESVKCHFRELGKDPHTEKFTAIGIGDMMGDVFGNGMLMTDKVQLVAAFNHMHIFLDPNPDVKKSYQERIRLFNMSRSSWENYNPKHISEGGGVFKRSAKAIKISPQVKERLGINKDVLVPNELIKAILKADVDLIWNGGIGTFVKASYERNEDVGDRTNDHVRVNANELRAKIVGEGGNLGFTQLGRIEFDLNGGRIITDFIDNSGGVDCSDREVNIKILLGKSIENGSLSLKQRNRLLAAMTDDVANLVLTNNYRQARALSYFVYQSKEYLDLYRQMMNEYEDQEKLPRALEFLPSDQELQERKAAGLGLTRPELAVLMAYTKILLKKEILNSPLIEDPELFQFVFSAFPKRLAKKYSDAMHDHRLRKEIIATQLSNEIITYMGITFVFQMQDETDLSPIEVVKAYLLASLIFDIGGYYADIKSLDYMVPTGVHFELMGDVTRLIRRATRWFLRHKNVSPDIKAPLQSYTKDVSVAMKEMPASLLGAEKEYFDARMEAYTTQGVPQNIAKKFALSRAAYSALNIIDAARTKQVDVLVVQKIYFALMDKLELIWFREEINSYPINNHWAVLARSAFKGDLDSILRALTNSVLSTKTNAKKTEVRLQTWVDEQQENICRWAEIVADLRNAGENEFSMLSVAMRELVNLAQLSMREAAKDEIHLL